MVDAGYALNSSLTFTIVLNVGAIVGTLVLGRLADAWGVKRGPHPDVRHLPPSR